MLLTGFDPSFTAHESLGRLTELSELFLGKVGRDTCKVIWPNNGPAGLKEIGFLSRN